MSGSAPLRRPDTARPRGAAPDESDAPTRQEQELIERELALLTRFSGAHGTHVAELDALVVRLPGRGPGYNFAACLRWPASEVEQRLEALAGYFHAAREWPALVVADGLAEPIDLAARLARLDWVELERERIYATRRQPTVPHLSPALRVEAVTARSAGECQQIEQQVFGLAEGYAAARTEHLARAVEAGELRAYLVRLDGSAVASARLSASDGLAAISGVGVMPEQRGKGFATLITAIATRAALAMGNSLVWLSVDERNEPALKVYRRLGYGASFGWSRWAASAR